MADLDLITELRVVATAEGVPQAEAAVARLGATVERAANANDDLAASEQRVAVAGEQSTRYRISAANAAERLQRQLDAEFRAQKQMESALRDIERARQQGIISASREGELIRLAEQRYGAAANAVNRAAAANANHAQTTGIAAHQLQNLGFQINDVLTSLASGAPVFQVFAQQGGQIAQVLGETGVGAAVRGVGGVIARFLTPATVTVGALAGAVIYGFSAWSRYDDETRRVGVTLQGLGRETGLTRDAFEKLATSAAAAGNITVRQASDLGTTLAATGRIGPENIGKLIAVSKDLAATFGTDLDGIKEKLTAFGTVEGITRLNEQLQFLDARTLRVVQSLFQAGREQDAIRLAVEKLPAALAKAETAQSATARAWEAVKNAASDADNAVGRFLDRLLKGPAPDERLKQLQQRIEALKAADAENLVQPGGTTRTYTPPSSPTVASTTAVPVPPSRPTDLQAAQSELEKYMEKLAETKRQEEAVAAQKELEASLNRKSNEAKKLSEEVGIGSDTWRKYKDMQIAIDDVLKSGNPELMRRVDNVKDLSEASSILEHVVKSTSTAEGERLTAGDKAAEQRRIDIASTRAVTVEEKARVAQMQAEARQRGQMVTVQQAQADAEHAAQMVREQSDQQLRQMLRDQGLEADGIQKRIELIGQGAEAQAVAAARQRTEQDLTRQGIDLNSDLARSVIAGAEANARLGVSYDKAVEAQQRMLDGQRELGSEFSTFVTDMLSGGQKIGDAFANLSKTLSGNTLKALLTGEGPLAGILGAAPSDRGQLGGLLGGKINLGGLFDTDKITDALGVGAETGIGKALAEALKPSKAGGGALSSPLGQGLVSVGAGAAAGYSSQSPLVGAATGALAGLATGNPILAVASAGAGLLGGLFGESQAKAAAKKKLQQEIQARREALEQARPQIEQLTLTFEGGSAGNVGKQIEDARAQAKAAAKTASDAGDRALGDKVVKDFEAYVLRMTAVYVAGFEGVLGEVRSGFGTGGPFATAVSSVQALGESLKGFVADAGRFANPDAQERARAAAVEGALGQIDAPKTLSATQTELARIQGTAAGLTQVLRDLGLSADQAAQAIAERTAAALDALRDKFADDLGRKVNDAQGRGYLNDVADLLKEVATLGADAGAVGGDLTQVQAYFQAAAQKIVDGAGLSGDALADLTARFPTLVGVVQAAGASLDAVIARQASYRDRAFAAGNDTDTLAGSLAAFDRQAAQQRLDEAKAGNGAILDLEAALGAERTKIVSDFAEKANDALAARLKGYADRLFAATTDTSTLDGQLAAYNRQALAEREEEIKAGGDAIAELEQAQAAERIKIITDYGKQAADALAQQLAAAQSAFDAFAKTIRTFVDGLRAGSSSPLAPKDRLAAAQSQYDAQLALAQTGDRTALDGITQYASALLDAGKAYNASSAAYQTLFERVTAQLTALPTQVSAEQFIVDAIDASKTAVVSATQAMQAALLTGIQANSPALVAAALSGSFGTLDASVNGLLDVNEFLSGLGPLATSAEQQAARAIFNAIDANGDGQLSKLELANASSGRVETYTAQTKATIDTTNVIAGQQAATANVQVDRANQQKAVLDYLASIQLGQSGILDDSRAVLNAINGLSNNQAAQLAALNNQFAFSPFNAPNGIRLDNNLVTALNKIVFNTANTVIGQKAGAAYIFASGGLVTGPGTGTSDSISARLSNGEYVITAEAVRRFGVDRLDAINDNSFAVPTVAMPVPVAAGGGEDGEVATLLARQNDLLTEQNALLRQQITTTAAGAQHVGARVDSHAAETRKGNTDRRQDSNRPRTAGSRVG